MPNGLLLINKPEGMRSTDCVNGMKAASGKKFKVGHAGTLDSTASGLLILLIGSATRLSDMVMMMPKIYRATLCLGQATDTCDASGQAIFHGDPSGVTEADIDRLLPSFQGWRMQRPPEISALKVGGRASHKLARSGQAVDLPPRPVFIQSIRRVSPLREGRVKIEVHCGKGTYIRSIARDIGEMLGCGAFAESLFRFATGPFNTDRALPPRHVEDLVRGGSFPVRSPREVGAFFHRVLLTPEAEGKLSRGIPIPLSGAGRCVPGVMPYGDGLCLEGAKMIGFADCLRRKGFILLKPKLVIPVEAERGGTP